MTRPDLAELRRLAEAAREPWRSKTSKEWIADKQAFEEAASPDVMLALLDELEAKR